MKDHAAVILAGGKGKRMALSDTNKVTVTLSDKPMISHIVDFMKGLSMQTIIVVVGFAKESVIETLQNQDVIFAEQKEQLGTGHALMCALAVLPEHIHDVVVVYGDDAVLYAEKHKPTIDRLFQIHDSSHAAVSFLTIEQDNPFGLGRIIRDANGKATAIVEEKDATEEQKKITEINPGCFIFSVAFLKTYLPQIEKNKTTGEYYLTCLIDIAFHHGEKVETVQGGKMAWRGINTKEELKEAERLYKEAHQ